MTKSELIFGATLLLILFAVAQIPIYLLCFGNLWLVALVDAVAILVGWFWRERKIVRKAPFYDDNPDIG